jgi:DNA-binding LytR/AlgR family response regulator
MLRETITDLSNTFDPKRFFRVPRSLIMNIDRIAPAFVALMRVPIEIESL